MPPNQYISYWLVGVFVNYLIESKIIFASSCSFVRLSKHFLIFLAFLFSYSSQKNYLHLQRWGELYQQVHL